MRDGMDEIEADERQRKRSHIAIEWIVAIWMRWASSRREFEVRRCTDACMHVQMWNGKEGWARRR